MKRRHWIAGGALLGALAVARFGVPGHAQPLLGIGQDDAASLLKVGARAPDFTLKTDTGNELALGAVRKKAKATLVNFWFYG